MSTRSAKAMLSIMKLADEAVGIVVANDGQGPITIDDFDQLNEKSVEGLCCLLKIPRGTTLGVCNPGVAVSAMAEANLQVMIYYIKNLKMIGRTCTHADVDIAKVREMYHQRYMEEAHKDPEVVPTVNPKDWPKTLETVEDHIRGF